jgi:ParB-like chromosome segregation protein Spo0J
MKPNIQIWGVERLVPYEKNAKTHDKKQVAGIKNSLKQFGWNQPISVDKDGVIIAGHGRRLATLELIKEEGDKWKDVPVWVRDDLTPEQVRALRLVDNKVAVSSIDTEIFRRELADLDFDLTSFFDAKELDFAVADLGSINVDAFVDDVGAAVSAQESQTKETADALQDKRVPVARVLGIKDIKGSNQIHITRLVAEIERRVGLKGEDALVAFSQSLLAGVPA